MIIKEPADAGNQKKKHRKKTRLASDWQEPENRARERKEDVVPKYAGLVMTFLL